MADLKDGVLVVEGKVIGRGGGTSGANCKYKTFTISTSSITASSKYARYAYEYADAVAGMKDTDWVDVSIISGEYDGNYAVESNTDKVTVYFGFKPLEFLTVNVYYIPSSNESEG